MFPTFGMFKGAQSEGSDSAKFTVKPFCEHMKKMYNDLTDLLYDNRKEYGLSKVDLSNDFNSFGIIIYHSLDGIKTMFL